MPPPVVTDVSPVGGDVNGAYPVVLTGFEFTGATEVAFYDTDDDATYTTVSFTVDSDTQITIPSMRASAHGAGIINFQVTGPGGPSDLDSNDAFTFTGELVVPPTSGDCIVLTVGGFVADGVTPDSDGIVYTVQSLTGWWDTPPVRSETMEAQPTGEYPTVFRENARRPVLAIVAHDPTGAALGGLLCWTAIATVKTAFDALSVPVLMEVADGVNDRSALVRLAAPIRTSILGNTVAVRLEISLIAPNPTLT